MKKKLLLLPLLLLGLLTSCKEEEPIHIYKSNVSNYDMVVINLHDNNIALQFQNDALLYPKGVSPRAISYLYDYTGHFKVVIHNRYYTIDCSFDFSKKDYKYELFYHR